MTETIELFDDGMHFAEDEHGLYALPGNLDETKTEISRLLFLGDALMFEVARLVRYIEEKEFYKQEVNQDTGNPYRSMSEYLPDLLVDLKAQSKLHKLSVRQVREYMALHRVFVEGMGLTAEQVMNIGPGNATEIREALDYDPRTGQVADTPRPGKIGRTEVAEILDTIKDSEGNWRVADTRSVLDEMRGVNRRSYFLKWRGEGGHYTLAGVKVYENGLLVEDDKLTYAHALEITKKAGALSNLEEEPNEEA